MRQKANPVVQQALDSKIREGQKNISYLQESLRKLQLSQQSGAPAVPPKDDFGMLPNPRPAYAQQPGPGSPKSRNHTKLGKSTVCFRL